MAFRFDKLTIKAQEAVQGAQQAAAERGNPQVDALHLLSALVSENEGVVTPIFEKMGVREGRRVVGDYMLTVEDCLGEARFDDMVAACGYAVDIHDPDGSGGTVMQEIPGSGYYHIPRSGRPCHYYRNSSLRSNLSMV